MAVQRGVRVRSGTQQGSLCGFQGPQQTRNSWNSSNWVGYAVGFILYESFLKKWVMYAEYNMQYLYCKLCIPQHCASLFQAPPVCTATVITFRQLCCGLGAFWYFAYICVLPQKSLSNLIFTVVHYSLCGDSKHQIQNVRRFIKSYCEDGGSYITHVYYCVPKCCVDASSTCRSWRSTWQRCEV